LVLALDPSRKQLEPQVKPKVLAGVRRTIEVDYDVER
jgi:hypothetical protein